MKRHEWRVRVWVILVLTLIPVSAPWALDLFWRMHAPEMTTRITKKMKTVCVGRFLIDVPSDAQVTLSQALVDGFNIFNYGGESKQEFDARVSRREAEINAEEGKNGRKNMVSARDVRHADLEGKIFVFGFSSGSSVENGVKVVYSSVSVDGFVQVNGITFRFFAKGYKPEDVDDLARLLEQFQWREDGIIPTQPGFFLDSALVRDPLTIEQGENIVMFAGLPGDWETQGTEDDVLRPFVSLELQTGISPRAGGQPVQSILSEASLGDLWRRMSSSLRLHSTAAAPAPAPAPPR